MEHCFSRGFVSFGLHFASLKTDTINLMVISYKIINLRDNLNPYYPEFTQIFSFVRRKIEWNPLWMSATKLGRNSSLCLNLVFRRLKRKILIEFWFHVNKILSLSLLSYPANSPLQMPLMMIMYINEWMNTNQTNTQTCAANTLSILKSSQFSYKITMTFQFSFCIGMVIQK